ncbi:hypothetical protein N7448_005449 [Penicillium atrosanguineum]|uniref:SnoaL-like domain-containing protein n=1 Tax=Penicillium atrosanguineum TaxID=1132637 RepID=A0A9W9H3K9_9EURO|nr:uncharacterized protein N7443_009178 [Penicillium atrosanguineum]KAJ5126137.1 hypothetical protein N7526_008314 [Penicillium atrosanguineum]KAJ5136895.1 hypothetical protein N7448_005449 [Penicillium atrosanguineum]KAJ5293225.1 hypothetical protein N7443_009178 [Penicillium atrosanguineum]KAJ5302739.1 hypothetical protein N7476_009538 [Penicillium atrosanguineum]
MSYLQSLPNLNAKEAIADALHRTVIGIDRNNISIFDSAFAGEDIIFEMNAGENEKRSIKGLAALKAGVFGHVGPMDTTHMISNVRINHKEGEDTASMTAYALAMHGPHGRGQEPDGPKLTTGGEYSLDLVMDHGDGLWKIKKWTVDIVWRQGDRSVMARPSPSSE